MIIHIELSTLEKNTSFFMKEMKRTCNNQLKLIEKQTKVYMK